MYLKKVIIKEESYLLAESRLADFAPAFTFSLCESENSRKWNIPPKR